MCMLCILGMRGEGGIELESLVAVVRIVFILNTKAPQCLVFSIITYLQELLTSLSNRVFKVFFKFKKLFCRLPQLLISFWYYTNYDVSTKYENRRNVARFLMRKHAQTGLAAKYGESLARIR
jgi:hypothetical protein